jgi:hypothetical protein
LRTSLLTTPTKRPGGEASPQASELATAAASYFPLWCFVLALCSLLAFVSLTAGGTTGSPREIAILALLGSLASLVCVRQLYPTRESSASFLFILCFSLFNLGLTPFVALGIAVPTFGLGTYDTNWLFSTAFPRGLALATLGLLCLLVGTSLGRLLGHGQLVKPDRQVRSETEDALMAHLGTPGAVLMGFAVFAFFTIALTHGGPGVFTSGYANWLDSTQGAPLPYVYALIGFGTGILAISKKSQSRNLGFFFFVVYGLAALLIGLRGEVFFPVVSAMVMGAFRFRLLNGKRLLAVLIVGLLLISGIRTFRDVGFPDVTARSINTTGVSFNAVDGLAELGYSLRPSVVVIQWQEQGQPGLDGASFESPFVRLAHSALPLLGHNTPVKSDPDILNSVVLQRVGPIGFSQIAEGYDNWGTAGVIGFLLLIGLGLAWIDCSPSRTSSLLIRNSVFVPLLLEVRNTFTPVPAQILLGLVTAFVVLAVAHTQANPPGENGLEMRPVQLASRR